MEKKFVTIVEPSTKNLKTITGVVEHISLILEETSGGAAVKIKLQTKGA